MVRGRRLALGVLVVLFLGASAGSAAAATITVTTTFDDQSPGDGQCSLRKAIADVDSPGSSQTDCAPAAFGSNTIVLGAQRYQLGTQFGSQQGQLTIAPTVTNLTVIGVAASSTTIDAGQLSDRVFQISNGATVTLRNLTIANGGAPGGSSGSAGSEGQPGSNGGAILNQGTLAVNDAAITNSHAGNGGAGGAAASASGGDGGAGGTGGAIYNTGSLTLNGATIGNNTAGNGGAGGAGAQAAAGTNGGNGGAAGTGGGIENAGGTLTVIASTIRGNTAGNGASGGNGGSGTTTTGGNGGNGGAAGAGGGIWTDGGNLSVTNATLASNSAGGGGAGGDGGPGTTTGGNGGNGGVGGNGGGVGAAAPSSAGLLQVTGAGNSAGAGGAAGGAGTGPAAGTAGTAGAAGSTGGVFDQGSSITLRNSLLALNGGGNCSGTVLDGGFNLSFGDSTCPATFSSGDPNLGPLQNNGGPAPTISLQTGSAAINQIPASGANCPATDERGVPRPSGSSSSKCDIGAYEVTGPVAVTGAASSITLTGATVSANVIPNAGLAAVAFQYGTSTKYGSTSSVQRVGGVTATPVTAKLSRLAPNTIYHYRVVAVAMDGTSVGGDRTFTTSVTPTITGLSIAPRSFLASKGAAISYKDSMAATTTLVAFRCVKTRRGKCTHYSKLGSFTHKDVVGSNKVKIRGRFGGRKLLLGSYRLQLTPRAGGKAGKTVSTTFGVL
jgi:hypothetical protein